MATLPSQAGAAAALGPTGRAQTKGSGFLRTTRVCASSSLSDGARASASISARTAVAPPTCLRATGVAHPRHPGQCASGTPGAVAARRSTRGIHTGEAKAGTQAGTQGLTAGGLTEGGLTEGGLTEGALGAWGVLMGAGVGPSGVVKAVATEASPSRQQLEERGPVVVVDNYDSFTYNLCQYLGDLGCHYVVHRNDDLTVEELQSLQPRGILISPGPGTPDDSGISLQVVKTLGPEVPLFGVCMGLQCIGQAFGGNIVRAPKGVMHGKTSPVFHNQEAAELGLLAGLPSPFTAWRYHSLVIDKASFPEYELEGVQFHPESVITSNGMDIVRNFLKTIENYWA